MTDLERRVADLVAEQTGFKRDRIELSTRLGEDIGLDGDDAVEFFEKYGEVFHVDLTTLHQNWDRHFGPEVGGCGAGALSWMVVMGLSVVGGDLAHRFQPRIPMLAISIVLALLLGWACLKLWTKFVDGTSASPNSLISISVSDLAKSAAGGKWVIEYGK